MAARPSRLLIIMKKLTAKSLKLKASPGFTIVELLVSIAIFAVIVSFSVSTFVRALRSQRSVVALISANDNASLAIEAISRELRRGRGFIGDGFNRSVTFFNADQREIVYSYDNTEHAIMRREDNGIPARVTAPNVVVESAHFEVRDTDSSNDPILPRITMSFKIGTDSRDLLDVTTDIHTTVSSRGLNNPIPPQ